MKKYLDLLNRLDQYKFEDDEEAEGEQQVDLREMERRFLSDRLTGPMTLLYVAQLCKLANGVSINQKKELVIHIAGSNTVEMLGIIKWEYLAHRLPQLESMRLVFIGPELAEHEEEDSLISAIANGDGNPLGICGNCADQGRAIHYEVIRVTSSIHLKRSDPIYAHHAISYLFSVYVGEKTTVPRIRKFSRL